MCVEGSSAAAVVQLQRVAREVVPQGPLYSLAVDARGLNVLAAGKGGTLRLFEAATGRLVKALLQDVTAGGAEGGHLQHVPRTATPCSAGQPRSTDVQ